MQEWMIAMLVISVLLILRDMAKTIFSEMKKSAATLAYEQHPQKEKMQRYAESFQKLANSFYGMPYRKDYLSSTEIDEMIQEVQEGLCKRCHFNQVCWKQNSVQSYQRIYSLLRIMEEDDEEKFRKAKADLTGVCISQGKLVQELQSMMDRERQNLIWNNKLLENRVAVAEQLGEMAELMKVLSRDLFDMIEADVQFREEFARRLKKRHIQVRNVWYLEQPDGKLRYYAELRAKGKGNRVAVAEQLGEMAELMKVLSRDLFDMVEADVQFREEFARRLKKRHIHVRNVWYVEQTDGKLRYYSELRAKGKGCVPAGEAAAVLSKMCQTHMTPKESGKTLINREFSVLGFAEEVNFKMLYGAVKITKDKETISGDNYTCATEDNLKCFTEQ